MTIEELERVPFHFVIHLSCSDEHTTTYQSDDGRLAFCDHVPTGVKRGRTYRHYWIDHKVYKTKKAFLEAIKDFEL